MRMCSTYTYTHIDTHRHTCRHTHRWHTQTHIQISLGCNILILGSGLCTSLSLPCFRYYFSLNLYDNDSEIVQSTLELVDSTANVRLLWKADRHVLSQGSLLLRFVSFTFLSPSLSPKCSAPKYKDTEAVCVFNVSHVYSKALVWQLSLRWNNGFVHCNESSLTLVE